MLTTHQGTLTDGSTSRYTQNESRIAIHARSCGRSTARIWMPPPVSVLLAHPSTLPRPQGARLARSIAPWPRGSLQCDSVDHTATHSPPRCISTPYTSEMFVRLNTITVTLHNTLRRRNHHSIDDECPTPHTQSRAGRQRRQRCAQGWVRQGPDRKGCNRGCCLFTPFSTHTRLATYPGQVLVL